MTTLSEIREKYPQYADMPDQDLADGLYRKFYSDMDRSAFNEKIEVMQAPASPEAAAPEMGAPAEPQPGPQIMEPAGLMAQGPVPGMGQPQEMVQDVPVEPLQAGGQPGVNEQALRDTVHGMMVGALPEGLGALQKPLDTAADYWGEVLMTEEDEKRLRAKYPNMMAARYAAASLLLPGVSEKFASPEEMNEFVKKSPEEQRLEILGMAAGYMAFGAAAKGAQKLAAVAAKKFPWLNEPIGSLLKKTDWYRRATNRERGLVVQSVEQMKESGLTEAEILRNLRKSGNMAEFQRVKSEAIRSRQQGMAETAPEQPRQPAGEELIRDQENIAGIRSLQREKGQGRPQEAPGGAVQEPVGGPAEAQPGGVLQTPPEGQITPKGPERRVDDIGVPPEIGQERRAGQDRRQDLERRKLVSEMTPEEMRQELKTSFKTGLQNDRAYEETPKKAIQASIDVDGLKWVNDNLGHQEGDKLLRHVGRALLTTEKADDVFHISGDEFVFQAETVEEVDAGLKAAAKYLKENPLKVEAPDGTITTVPVRFSYGKGTTYQEADALLKAAKAESAAQGKRAERGTEPPGVLREPAQGKPVDSAGAGGVENPPALEWGNAPTGTKSLNSAPATEAFWQWYHAVGKNTAAKQGFRVAKTWRGDWYIYRTKKNPDYVRKKEPVAASPKIKREDRKKIPGTKWRPIPKGQRRSKLLTEASRRLEVPIRKGKFRTRVGSAKAAGIYKTKAKVIRLARANDVEVAVHEIGHHVEDLLGLPRVMPDEIRAMAYEGAKDVDREGFAEFLRFYVTQPKKAKTEAPEFYKQFEGALSDQPDVQDVIVKIRQAHEVWEAAPSVAKVHSFIQRGGTSRGLPTMNEIYRQAKDAIYPLSQAVKAAEQFAGKELPVSDNPYLMARLTRGWARKAEQFLKHQTFQYDKKGGVEFTGSSLREILQPIERSGEMELLDTYLVAKRALNDPRILEGFDEILSKEDFAQTVTELEPKFKKTAEALYKYSDELLKYLVSSGRIGKQTEKAIREKNLFYAPLYRVMDGEAPLGGLSARKFDSVFNPIKKLRGSSRDIYSPTESLLYNTYTTINAAERNLVGKAMIKLAGVEGMGPFIERVPPPLQPIKMTREEALKSLTKNMGQVDRKMFLDNLNSLPEGTLTDMAITFRPRYQAKPNEAIFFEDGKPIMFELSPDMAKAVTNISASDIGLLTQILAYPAKWLRAGATTFSPEFGLRNPLRDQMTAWIQSKYGFTPGVDFLRGLYHMLKKDELWQKFNASGAAHSAIVSMDRKYISKNLKEMLEAKGVKGVVKHPLQFLQAFSEATEEATRIGEFVRALKAEGGDYNALLRAGFAGREVSIDFARQGEGWARAANAMSAFWNARIEGIDKMVRTFKDQPKKALAKAFLGITVPSILIWYVQKDDEYYQELPAWRRTLFWNFVIHNTDGSLKTIISIPKPFEYGLIFGSLPESALDWAYTKDPSVFKETAESVGETFKIAPLPTGLIPIAEWWGNKSMFFERPIVPRGKEDLDPVLQEAPQTSETVKLVAKMMNAVPGLKEVASPAKIENLIRGYTAGFGRLALEQSDWLLDVFGVVDAPPDPSMTLADVPGLRAFAARFPSANTRSIEVFYEKFEKLNRRWESQKERAGIRGTGLKVGQPPELENYRQVAKTLSTMRKMANKIYESKSISPEEKREYLDNVYFGMINVARAALGKSMIKEGKGNENP